MSNGKEPSTGAPPTAAEEDADFVAGVKELKAKNYAAVSMLCKGLSSGVSAWRPDGSARARCADKARCPTGRPQRR
jgi:hypothetical protein